MSAELIKSYLSAMEARDLDAARAMLGDGFVMRFPGTGDMHRLEELIEWSKPRYQKVAKTYDGFDECGGVVYVYGTLFGIWPDGSEFEGIRYIDRFEIKDGLIQRQDVWNDMGEVRG